MRPHSVPRKLGGLTHFWRRSPLLISSLFPGVKTPHRKVICHPKGSSNLAAKWRRSQVC